MKLFSCPADKQCEHKCQMCGEHPAECVIKNKVNGNRLRICKDCWEYIQDCAGREQG